MPGSTFNANEIIGKTLIAKTRVNVRIGPSTSYPILYTTKPGESVGVVTSYDDKTSPGEIWWSIQSDRKIPGSIYYYDNAVQHAEGRFNIQSLRDQGAKTTAEILKEKADADKPWYTKAAEFAEKEIKLIVGVSLVLVGGGMLIRNSRKKKK